MTCVIDDLGIMLVAGRVKDPRAALHEAIDAERLGVRRALVHARRRRRGYLK